jgi:hypothetical protein
MKLQVTQVEIRNADGIRIAKVEHASSGAVGVTLHEEAFSPSEWRELADAVAQAIKMMEAE